MQIVETIEEFETMVSNIHDQLVLMIPYFSDVRSHPVVNPVSLIYLTTGSQQYVLVINHDDGRHLPSNCLSTLQHRLRHTNIITPSKKRLLHVLPALERITDIDSISYINDGEIREEASFYSSSMIMAIQRNRFFTSRAPVCIPLMVILEFFEMWAEYLWNVYGRRTNQELLDMMNEQIIPVCFEMEHKGIHIDSNKFIKKYGFKSADLINNGLVYCEYNPYTVAGRVSNHFGGINYASINKSDGTREMFVSRHKKGGMVLIDFESFHLRLIADLIGFDAPTEPFHEFMVKQYFKTDVFSPDLYDEGKRKTFQNLYSSHRDVSIPFFADVDRWEQIMWKTFVTEGKLQLSDGRILIYEKMENPSPGKMFNYILQWQETVIAFKALQNVTPLYKNIDSAIVLFTYDSILIDYNLEDGKELLQETVARLEQNGRFPVRVYAGPSYNNLHIISDLIKSK